MKIVKVEARWLHCPLPAERQHRSDLGSITAFDGVLVSIHTEDGLVGFGEAKPGVGSSGNGAALVTILEAELAPILLGADATEIQHLWGAMVNGSRAGLAAQHGRAMPILGRRGIHMCAVAGVDLALWDLAGKRHRCSVLDLVGGPCRKSVRAYASGGWAPADRIGDELARYIQKGFRSVKMRVGAMDGSIEKSAKRIQAARRAIGAEVDLMVDAHGTLNVAGAKRLCAAVESEGLRFAEEPLPSDDREGLAEVRRATSIAIAAGESEFSALDFLQLLRSGAIDVLQPDLAIAGGFSEGQRIAALAEAHRLDLAPHCWGSAISFQAARTLAFASRAGVLMEVPMGGAPLLHEMATVDLQLTDGALAAPTGHGFGVAPDPAFIERNTQTKFSHEL